MTDSADSLSMAARFNPAVSAGRMWIAWIVAALLAIAALYGGVRLRQWFFDVTETVHFHGDNERGWAWGAYTFLNMHDRGRSFLDTYDDVGIQDRHSPMWLDYAPARLGVVTAWAAWNHRTMPYQWRTTDRAFQAFFLNFNTVMELLGAAGAFMLVRHVLLHAGVAPARTLALSLAAALLLWFSPAMIISAHGWPNGDMWVVPPFLWAVYLGRKNAWFGAGIVLAIGTLFKGQILLMLPLFLIWPLATLRWQAALWLLAGLAGTFGLLTMGWTLSTVDAAHIRHPHWPAIVCTALPAFACIALLILRRRWPESKLARLRPTMTIKAAFGLTGTIALSAMPVFGTSQAWFDASYRFGTSHWPYMIMGVTSNLPGILTRRYGWRNDTGPNEIIFSLGEHAITLKLLLFTIFMTCVVFSAIAMAWHERRQSTRFLLAIVTPWLAFFAIPCQVHERYLLFAAGVACACIGHSVGTALLGLFLSVVTWVMTMHVMLEHGLGRRTLNEWNRLLREMYPALFAADTQFAQALHRNLAATFPDIGWAVLLALAIFMYLTLTPGRGRTKIRPVIRNRTSDPQPAPPLPRRPATPSAIIHEPIPLVDPVESPAQERL